MIAVPQDARARFPSYTLDTIAAILVVEALTTEELLRAVGEKTAFDAILAGIGMATDGSETNPSWLEAQIAEVLYLDRHAIEEKQFDRLCDNGWF